MMRLRRNILWAVLLVTLVASGCATANRESSADEALAEATPTEVELNDQLTRDQLSDAQLSAFEIRAQQKLRDFIDYLNIVSNPTLDSAFRTEATRQAEQLFTDSGAAVGLWSGHEESEKLSVRSLLATLIHTQESIAFTIDSLIVRQSITPEDSAQYRGSLSFRVSNTNSGKTGNAEHQADVVVRKKRKTFGEEAEVVWAVFLGDIQ